MRGDKEKVIKKILMDFYEEYYYAQYARIVEEDIKEMILDHYVKNIIDRKKDCWYNVGVFSS